MTRKDVVNYCNHKLQNITNEKDVAMIMNYVFYKKQVRLNFDEVAQAMQRRMNLNQIINNMMNTLMDEFKIHSIHHNNKLIKFY